MGTLLGWLRCSFILFEHFLAFGYPKCSRITLYSFCPDLESMTSRSSGSFGWRGVFKKQDLSAGQAHRCWGAMVKGHFFFLRIFSLLTCATVPEILSLLGTCAIGKKASRHTPATSAMDCYIQKVFWSAVKMQTSLDCRMM